jgi:hypothetical protein
MVAITCQPFAANSLAVALPIPAEAPVIKMVFDISSRCFSSDKAPSSTLAACSKIGKSCSQNGKGLI